MDLFAKVLLLFCVSLIRGQDTCYRQDWSSTFGAEGESMSQCRDNVSYVSGFLSQDYGEWGQLGLTVIKSAYCCNVNLPYSQEGSQCVWREWWTALVGRDRWITCNDTGYFLHGFVTIGSNYLYQMGKFQCCKPISHPNQDVGCTDIDVDFSQDGNKTCPSGRFLKGVHTRTDNPVKGGIRFLDQIRCCAMVPGRVDGSWSTWGAWSSCSLSCGGGSRRRRRRCDNPRPQMGGAPCPGSGTETEVCSVDPCPVDGGWTTWSAWSACTAQCNGGTRERTRSCTNPPPSAGGASCPGDSVDTESCNTNPCQPVDGGWSPWTAWSPCDYSCGGGEREKRRTCTNPPPAYGGGNCKGKSKKTQSCNKTKCVWTTWTNWSKCSVTCGGGTTKKTRQCQSKPPCKGKAERTKACATKACP